MKTRQKVQEFIEAPKQAMVLGLIALAIGVTALMVALAALASVSKGA